MWSKIVTASSYDLQLCKKFQVYFLLSTLLLLAFVKFSDAVVVTIYDKTRDKHHNISIYNGSLTSPYYNSSCMSLVYTFGFNGTRYGNTTITSIDGMLHYKNNICCANVFLLDWSERASVPNGIGELATKARYAEVAAVNVRQTGEDFADLLLNWVAYYGFQLTCLQLYGHSLGAHVMGNCGDKINRVGNGIKVSRIIGLDPAAPLYGGFPSLKALSKADATVVVIIHGDPTSNPYTSGITRTIQHYGMNETSGYYDIWLNYYTSNDQVQPGCRMGYYELLSADSLCSHNRAPEVYAITWRYQTCCFACLNGTIPQNQTLSQNETQSQMPTFQASGAPDYYTWAAGNGAKSTIVLGICMNNSASGNYYLSTTGTYPYAKGAAGAFPP